MSEQVDSISVTNACDPKYTWILYSLQLNRIDDSHPLHGVSYIGQCIRIGTPEELLRIRFLEHSRRAATNPAELGIKAAIAQFGADAFDPKIIDTGKADKEVCSEIANKREVEAIDLHGGVLQDMDTPVKIRQTFNLKKGGQGDSNHWWDGIQAKRNRSWNEYISHRKAFAEAFPSIKVIPAGYVCPDGYKLYSVERSVLDCGQMISGEHAEERVALLKSQGIWKMSHEDSWERYVEERKKHIELDGKTWISRDVVTDSGYRLGIIEDRVRTSRHFRGPSIGEAEIARRTAILNTMGFEWKPPRGPNKKRDLPRGVSRYRGRFSAAFKVGQKSHWVGTFDSPTEAAAALAKEKARVRGA